MTEKGAVLITGCSSGIGRALCGEFLRRGHRVVATARDPRSIADLETPDCLVTALDVLDQTSIDAAVARAQEWAGALEILVNNAGWGLMGPVAELEPADLRRQLETNVVGPAAVIRAVVPAMARRGRGTIVNVGSVSGVVATPFAGAYCASKAALHALSDSLRMEVKPFGIAVVSLQPGAVISKFGDSASAGLERYADETSLYRRFSEAVTARAAASQAGGMDAGEFARRAVDGILRSPPSAILRIGPLSRKLPLIGRLPLRLRDRLFVRLSGLGDD